jgi:hypothetical protein
VQSPPFATCDDVAPRGLDVGRLEEGFELACYDVLFGVDVGRSE